MTRPPLRTPRVPLPVLPPERPPSGRPTSIVMVIVVIVIAAATAMLVAGYASWNAAALLR
jgi:hypothetical protein